jgi:hypothetical protein
MHDLHHESLICPGRSRHAGISLAALATDEFDEWCEDDFGLRLELGSRLLE